MSPQERAQARGRRRRARTGAAAAARRRARGERDLVAELEARAVPVGLEPPPSRARRSATAPARSRPAGCRRGRACPAGSRGRCSGGRRRADVAPGLVDVQAVARAEAAMMPLLHSAVAGAPSADERARRRPSVGAGERPTRRAPAWRRVRSPRPSPDRQGLLAAITPSVSWMNWSSTVPVATQRVAEQRRPSRRSVTSTRAATSIPDSAPQRSPSLAPRLHRRVTPTSRDGHRNPLQSARFSET